MTWYVLTLLGVLMGGLITFGLGIRPRTRGRASWSRVVTSALLWVWTWSVVAMTLDDTPARSGLNLHLLTVTNVDATVDFIANVGLFLPAGVLLAVRGARPWVALVVGAGTSCCVEAAQFFLIAGRITDINDLLSNTLGALLGFLATMLLLALMRRAGRPRRHKAESASAPLPSGPLTD